MILDFEIFPKNLTCNTYLINIQSALVLTFAILKVFIVPEETPFDLKNESKRDMFLGKNP